MKKILFVIAIMVLACTLFSATGVNGDKIAPDFTAKDINNKTVQLSELLKKGPVIIDFWAMWCVPCKQSLPAYSKINTEIQKKYPNVSFIAVSIDKRRKLSKAKAYIRPDRFNFIKLFDPNGALQKKFGANSVPYTIMISEEGKIIFTHSSFKHGDEKVLKDEIIKYFKSKEQKDCKE